MAETISERFTALSENVQNSAAVEGNEALAVYHRKEVFSAMQALREAVDATELLVPTTYWPYPTYGEMLFGIR